MLTPLFFYIVLPFIAAWLIIRFIRKSGGSRTPASVMRLMLEDPLAKENAFRVVLLTSPAPGRWTAAKVGDFETLDAAVDAATLAHSHAADPSRRVVIHDRAGDIVQEV